MDTVRRLARGFAKLVRKYPVRAQAVVQSVIGAATAFGLGWSAQQVGAIVVLSASVLALLTEQAVTALEDPKIAEGTTITVVTPPGEANREVTV